MVLSTRNDGIGHFFVQKIADGELPYYKGWKVFEINWAKLNTQGLVDKAVDKTINGRRGSIIKTKILISLSSIRYSILLVHCTYHN